MPQNTDTDLTLPSVVASLPGRYREQTLLLTVIFHPQTARIGQTAVVPRRADNVTWVLGRHSPAFAGREEQLASPLDDPHVSRQALQFYSRGKNLLVRRLAGASRCRIAGRELEDSVTLEPGQLRKGVALMLGHAVVLLLRLAGRSDPATGRPPGHDVLLGASA